MQPELYDARQERFYRFVFNVTRAVPCLIRTAVEEDDFPRHLNQSVTRSRLNLFLLLFSLALGDERVQFLLLLRAHLRKFCLLFWR
jgi:hypothetical protein